MGDRVILYVEDEPDDVHIIETTFVRLQVNYTLQFVSNAREAMERLKNTGRFADAVHYPIPEIIFVDIRMPELSGFDLLRMVKDEASLQNIPVFMLTGSTHPEHRATAAELGAMGYVQKSWNMEFLVQSLDYINVQLLAALKGHLLIEYKFDARD